MTPNLLQGLDLVFLHVGVAEALAKGSSGAVDLAAGHRIRAIIGGIESARPVVAGKADAAERCVRRRAIGRLVPVDDARPNTGPELVVNFRAPADEARGEAEAGVVRLDNRRGEV